MKLYLVTQKIPRKTYDYFDSVIICAVNEDDAVCIHPSTGKLWDDDIPYEKNDPDEVWARPEDLVAEEIGVANEEQAEGVILASWVGS